MERRDALPTHPAVSIPGSVPRQIVAIDRGVILGARRAGRSPLASNSRITRPRWPR
jgi:hypothetical protein